MVLSSATSPAPGKPAPVTVSVFLGELRPAVDVAASAEGVGPSAWIAGLVRDALGARTRASGDGGEGAPLEKCDDAAAGGARIRLDSGLTRDLDRLQRREGLRSRPAAVRALLDGVIASKGEVAAQASPRADGDGAGLGSLVGELGRSNAQLVAVGRNLNQMVKLARAHPTKFTVADRMKLEATEAVLREHLRIAAEVVANLRPRLAGPR